MVGNTYAGFSEWVRAGEIIEVGLKMGKIQSASASSSVSGSGKKSFSGYPKKKENDSSVVYS